MWKLGIEDDQGNKTVVNLVRDEYSLGRAEDNTVRLTERNISRHHAALRRNGSGWIIEDRQSYNGCFVNGVRVSEPQRLEHGDLVQLGDYRLELTDDAMGASVGGPRAATVPAVPKSQMLLGQPDRFVMLVGPTPGAEFPLVGERIVIGRGEECDIAVNHSSVSRVHAEVHALGDGRYELVDRESANGIRLNGVELQRGLLDSRDNVELGDVVLKFIRAGEIYRPDAEEFQQAPLIASGAPSERLTPAPGVERGVQASMPMTVKIGAALVGLGLLVVLGIVAFRAPEDTGPEVAAAPVDGATKVLSEAMALSEGGNLEAAHLKITSEIPADSNARQSQTFRDIEAKWADMLFEKAAGESDPVKKKAHYQRIATTPTVDSVRRKQATQQLEQLQAAGVAVTDLPPVPDATHKPDQPAAATAALPGGIVRKDPFATSAKKPKPAGTATAAYKPTATSKPPPAPKPDVSDQAVSGDRQKMTNAKNALKSKVASGKATDQEKSMLRALCRQLGDMSCAQ